MAKPATRIAEAAIASKNNLGRLPTISHRPVIRREDERAPIGPDLHTSPDGKCSCLPRSSSLPRRELSLWSLRRPGSFKLMVLLQWRVQRRWWTARQVTARPQLTDRSQWTARPQVTAQPQLTARPGTARQATVRPVTARQTARPQLIHLTAQLFTLMTRRSRTTLHVIRRWEWTGRQAMEPRHGTTPAGGPDASILTGTSSPFFPAIPTSINQATLIDFMSMWTLLQRRMDQGMVPNTSASPAVPSSVPAPRHVSSSRRSDTQSGTPERLHRDIPGRLSDGSGCPWDKPGVTATPEIPDHVLHSLDRHQWSHLPEMRLRSTSPRLWIRMTRDPFPMTRMTRVNIRRSQQLSTRSSDKLWLHQRVRLSQPR